MQSNTPHNRVRAFDSYCGVTIVEHSGSCGCYADWMDVMSRMRAILPFIGLAAISLLVQQEDRCYRDRPTMLTGDASKQRKAE